jgi:hypothetical protein
MAIGCLSNKLFDKTEALYHKFAIQYFVFIIGGEHRCQSRVSIYLFAFQTG